MKNHKKLKCKKGLKTKNLNQWKPMFVVHFHVKFQVHGSKMAQLFAKGNEYQCPYKNLISIVQLI